MQASNELLTANVEQIRKIQVLEKEIEFWQTKVSDCTYILSHMTYIVYW